MHEAGNVQDSLGPGRGYHGGVRSRSSSVPLPWEDAGKGAMWMLALGWKGELESLLQDLAFWVEFGWIYQ